MDWPRSLDVLLASYIFLMFQLHLDSPHPPSPGEDLLASWTLAICPEVPRAEPLPAKALVIEDLGSILPAAFASVEDSEVSGFGMSFSGRTQPGQLAQDIALKLRIANGIHTAMVYAMALGGLFKTDDCIGHPHVLPYLEQLFERDIAHCCAELKLDRLAVTPVFSEWMARIQHPHFGLECFFVCQNASQKMGIRLLPSVRAALASNEAPSEFMIFALAVILRFLTPIGGFPKSMEGTVTCIMPFLDGKELAKVEAVCLKWRTLPDQLNTWDTLRQAYIARALDCLENLLGWEVENVIWPEEKGEGGPAKPYVGLLQSFVLELEEEDYSTCCECKVHYTRCCKDALSCQYCDKDWCPECARYAPSKDEVGCPDCPDWSKVSCRECFDQGKSIFCRCYGTDSWHYACGRHGFECKRCGEQLCFICEERHSYDCRDDGEEEEDETG
ncbi:unnamed protein product [Symbiodinium sp. KB8]|nr:unnamed protein product [Symbiodinium sp. KB8]